MFHRRFLHLWSDGGVNGGDRQIGQSESVPEYARFRIKVVEDGKVAVYGQVANRFLRVCTGEYLGHVDGHGGEKSFDALPDDWGDERFQIVTCVPPKQQQEQQQQEQQEQEQEQEQKQQQQQQQHVQLPEDFVLDGDFSSARLGAGAHGQTFRVQNIHDEQVYCLKQFFNANNPTILREIRNLAHLPHHDNVVRYYSTRKLNNDIFLQLDYIAGQQLSKKIPHGLNVESFQSLGYSTCVQSWVRQLFDGLAHLHTKMVRFSSVYSPSIGTLHNSCFLLSRCFANIEFISHVFSSSVITLHNPMSLNRSIVTSTKTIFSW